VPLNSFPPPKKARKLIYPDETLQVSITDSYYSPLMRSSVSVSRFGMTTQTSSSTFLLLHSFSWLSISLSSPSLHFFSSTPLKRIQVSSTCNRQPWVMQALTCFTLTSLHLRAHHRVTPTNSMDRDREPECECSGTCIWYTIQQPGPTVHEYKVPSSIFSL